MMALKIEGADVSIKNSIIRNNFSRGAVLTNSNSSFDGVEFSNNTVCHTEYADYGGCSLEIRGGSSGIKNSIFKNNATALCLEGSYGSEVQNNTFESNARSISLYNSSGLFSNNNISENEIFVSGFISQPSRWTKDLSPYVVKGILEIADNASLTIDPGVTIKFKDNFSGLKANGSLVSDGALFTSANENPSPGDWGKIEITSTSKDSKLNNATIEYAGGDPAGTPCSSNMAGLKITGANVEVNNLTAKNILHTGVHLINYPSELINPSFENIVKCMDTYGGEAILIENTP